MIYSWHKPVWDQFSKARRQDHLPHALLLSGEEGIAKVELANNMVKSLLCTAPVSKDLINYMPCDSCQACKTYESDANPDYLHIDLLESKQQIGIDQVRLIANFLNYTRSLSQQRVVLLNSADRMNVHAANSLLKSLEEPTQDTVIILISSRPESLLATIKSRCQLLHIPLPTKQQALDWLQKHKPELENPHKTLQIAHGKPLIAADIDNEIINNYEELAGDILDCCLEKKSITELAKKWEKGDIKQLLDWQIIWLQNYLKNAPNISDKHKKIKEKLTTSQKWSLYQALIEQKKLVHTSVNTLMFIENMLLLWLKASRC